MLLRILAFAVGLAVSSAAAAEQIQLWGRAYDYSCGYFSRRAADLSLTLADDTLPYGTEVNAIVGFAGKLMLGGPNSRDLSWVDRLVIKAKAINTGTWEARLEDKTLHGRTEGRFLDRLQFVFEVLEPGKPPRYINGGSTWGYFQSETITVGTECVQDNSRPAWRSLDFDVVTVQ